MKQPGRGTANALVCSLCAAKGAVIAMLDAEGSAGPAETPRFVATLLSEPQFAAGTRFIPGGAGSEIATLRWIGNTRIAKLLNYMWGASTMILAMPTTPLAGAASHL